MNFMIGLDTLDGITQFKVLEEEDLEGDSVK